MEIEGKREEQTERQKLRKKDKEIETEEKRQETDR